MGLQIPPLQLPAANPAVPAPPNRVLFQNLVQNTFYAIVDRSGQEPTYVGRFIHRGVTASADDFARFDNLMIPGIPNIAPHLFKTAMDDYVYFVPPPSAPAAAPSAPASRRGGKHRKLKKQRKSKTKKSRQSRKIK